MAYLRLVLFLPSLLCCSATSDNHPDTVLTLPGAPRLPQFPLYSGYLNASSSLSNGTTSMFYVLAESIRSDPSSSPLLIWLNGGPGSSSLMGFFMEHGPYRVTERGDVLEYHEYSWNQYCNVLYLESPIGVGFSVDSEGRVQKYDGDTADVNYNAINDFMFRVHPRYANRDFYLTGQSYAGVYIPFLARRWLQSMDGGEQTNTNFRGFAIGNGIFDHDSISIDVAVHRISTGLLPIEFSNTALPLWESKQKDRIDIEELKRLENRIGAHTDLTIGRNSAAGYNMAVHCFDHEEWHQVNYFDLHDFRSIVKAYHGSELNNSIYCYGKDSLTAYMNRLDMQVAMHATNFSIGRKDWESGNGALNVGYQRVLDVYHLYKTIFTHTQTLSSFRILIYNGDLDAVIPPLHAAYCTAKIAKLNSLKNLNEHPSWRFFNDFAGSRIAYSTPSGNVTMEVLTVRGAGHAVPID